MKFLLASTVALSLRTFYADMPRRLRALGHDVVALASPDSDLDALAEETQTRTLPVAMARRISPLADLRAMASVAHHAPRAPRRRAQHDA